LVEPVLVVALADGRLGRPASLLKRPWAPPEGEVGSAALFLRSLTSRGGAPLPEATREEVLKRLTAGGDSKALLAGEHGSTEESGWSNSAWNLAADEQLARLAQGVSAKAKSDFDALSPKQLADALAAQRGRFELLSSNRSTAGLWLRYRVLCAFNGCIEKLLRWVDLGNAAGQGGAMARAMREAKGLISYASRLRFTYDLGEFYL
jgi:hypothetical protein